MTDPTYCPLGPEDGCEIKDGAGTCSSVLDGSVRKGTVRLCSGYAAMVCRRAFNRWVKDGRQPSGAELDRPPAPRVAPGGGWMDPAFTSAPADLDAWQLYAGVDGQSIVRDYAAGVMARYIARDPTAPNLVFLGGPGTGKTLLARIIGRRVTEGGQLVRFVVFRELLLGIKATRSMDSTIAEQEIVRAYQAADLLVLDDVRPVFNSQDDENIADELLKGRYGEDRGGVRRPTIVTSNLNYSELGDIIGEAAMRRLYCDGDVERQVFDWPAWSAPENGTQRGHWSEGTFCLFDLESTGPKPKEDRIIQASFIIQRPDCSAGEGGYTTLVNPGVEISPGAVAVHGITDAQVVIDGVEPAEALRELARRFQRAAERGYPVVVFNVPFDWVMFQAECKRHGVAEPMTRPMFVDPLLIDRKVDKYRRGSRKLEDMVKHYLGRTFEAHDAEADALETGRLLREMVRRHAVLHRSTLEEMQDFQAKWYESWRVNFNKYQRGPKGKGYVNNDRWPL